MGLAFIDHKGNPRVRGLWATTPIGEYVKSLVAQCIVDFGYMELEASVDDAGARVYHVLGVSFTVPTDPSPAQGDDSGGSEPAAELLGLAARIYAAAPAEQAALVDEVIGCAVALCDTR